jgi:long-chain acyl-CoA synthetase
MPISSSSLAEMLHDNVAKAASHLGLVRRPGGGPAPVGSVADIIRRRVAETPDKAAIRFAGGALTWGQLDQRANAVAQALIAAGVAPQDRVAFIDKNGLEYFELSFGAAKANAVVVAVNWRLAPPEVLYTVNDAKAKVLIVGPDFYAGIEQIEAKLETVETIIAVGRHPRWRSWSEWLAMRAPEDPMLLSAPEDVCMQLYTSGTTGLPKGVMTTNANLFTLLDKVVANWRLDASSVNLVCMPLFHIGGCGWAMCGMHLGAVSVLAREFVPGQILDLMQTEKVTNALFVPAMLGFMAQVPGAAQRSFPGLRSIIYGASPITDQTLLAAMDVFRCEFVQVYGMTETTGAITELPAADHDPKGNRAHLLRSAGKPYPWVEARIVDLETGSNAAPGKVGELWTRSPQNMKGYWNKPEETARTLTPDGWLKTGDAGFIDEEGYLFLTDRVKDMIVSGGENVYPAEVENVLAAHPAIAEVAVIGVPDERWGETVKAVVTLKAGAALTGPELIAWAKERLAGYKCPTSVDFMPALPRNPSGKVLKKDLRAPYWAGKARGIN